DVVVGDGAVFVGPGDAVDAKPSFGVVVTQRPPQARSLDEQLEPCLALERLVTGRSQVAANGVGDVRVDVERGRACGPVARAFLAGDRAPREGSSRKAELLRAFACE